MIHHPVREHLQSFQRRVDVSRRAACARFFAGHVPRFDGLPEFQLDAALLDGAVQRKAKLEMRIEPFDAQRIAGLVQVGNDIFQILTHKMRQHETVVDFRAPPDQFLAIGVLPEMRDQGAKQEVLREAHPRMRRHFKRAHFEQAEAARSRVGRVELVDAELGAVRAAGRVDQQVSEDAVHQPRRSAAMVRNLLKRDFHFVDLIVARFVDARRLARGSDKDSAEEVRQRGMVVPVADQAAQQSGIPQDRRIGGRSLRRSECDFRRRCRCAGRRA